MKQYHFLQTVFFTFLLASIPASSIWAQTGTSQKLKSKKVVEYYQDSTNKHIKYEYTVVLIDSAPFELKNGQYKWYYEDGKLKARSWFVMGQRDSLYTSYFRSGGLKEEVIYRQGKLNGTGKTFYPGGGIENIGEYVNDQKDGVWKYYEGGVLIRTEKWDKGKKLP